MTGTVNLREVILGILMEVTEQEAYSHIALRDTLDKYQYLPKRDRAFVSRVTEGTLDNLIQIDYIIECFSKVPIHNMKPLIRNLLRMSIYQLKYMDSVPDSAAINEAVKLSKKRGFSKLSGFVNANLRNVSRNKDELIWPDREKNCIKYLSVRYSVPEWICRKWTDISPICAP